MILQGLRNAADQMARIRTLNPGYGIQQRNITREMDGWPFVPYYVVHILQKFLVLELVAVAQIHVIVQKTYDSANGLIALEFVQELLLGNLVENLDLALWISHDFHELY